MIFINSQEIRYFYRNIVKTNNVYRIKYKNKDYGEFKNLSDALYERDALFYCNFDYDLLVECDLENKYENMDLPPFPTKRSKGRIKGTKVNKEKREGEILFNHSKKKFYVKKEDKIYKYCDTMTEAYYIKKILMENNWNENSIKQTITEKIEVNIVIDSSKEYEVKISFCPNCRHKIKNSAKECPYCGYKIED
ncbi:MAG: zinc ribbon domain-containing protein [Methanobrevibacter sp.]|uniref:zinc ribbon domain-containing protein n=1 Tax=Methanobrevibacter sp. TaxID=66852 RepID=UPI0026DF307C|nr:zinc ribbon domain-containing protein [Methanobrevibacter sp.]MDO5848948.1 zinc ribbon domain-containing protein [Methanobrevibacter sp.]